MVVAAAHAEGHEHTGQASEPCNDAHGGGNAVSVGDDLGEQRADSEAAVAPQPDSTSVGTWVECLAQGEGLLTLTEHRISDAGISESVTTSLAFSQRDKAARKAHDNRVHG